MHKQNKSSIAYRVNHLIPRGRLPEISGIIQEIMDGLPKLTAKQLYSRIAQIIHGKWYRERVRAILDWEYYLPTNLDVGGRNSLAHLVWVTDVEDWIKLIEESFWVKYNQEWIPREDIASKIDKINLKRKGPTPETEKTTYQEFESYYQSRITKCPNKEWKTTLENNIPKENDVTIEDWKVRLSRGYIAKITRIAEDDIIDLIYAIVGDFNTK